MIKDFSKYFIVGTNSYALHDTMNGMVVGELIRCKDCDHSSISATIERKSGKRGKNDNRNTRAIQNYPERNKNAHSRNRSHVRHEKEPERTRTRRARFHAVSAHRNGRPEHSGSKDETGTDAEGVGTGGA